MPVHLPRLRPQRSRIVLGLGSALLAGMLGADPGMAAPAPVLNRLERRLALLLGPHKGSIVMMRVADGRLAAVVNPALAASRSLPPGSVMKVPTLIAGWEEHLLTTKRTIECRGPKGNPPCWMTHGRIDVVTAVSLSCSAYASTIGRELGPRRMTTWWQRLGFGRRTGVDLPGEVSGTVALPTASINWTQAAVGEGGGLAVTPMQVVSLYGAIANGGRRWRPSRFQPVALLGLLIPGSRQPNGLDLAILQRGLQSAAETGSARGVSSPGLTVAGKTGTASMPGFKDRTSGWFAGYAPARYPKVAIVVQLDDAKGNQHAVPLARKALQAWLAETR